VWRHFLTIGIGHAAHFAKLVNDGNVRPHESDTQIEQGDFGVPEDCCSHPLPWFLSQAR
jgi:hypothetical protein